MSRLEELVEERFLSTEDREILTSCREQLKAKFSKLQKDLVSAGNEPHHPTRYSRILRLTYDYKRETAELQETISGILLKALGIPSSGE